MLKLKIKIHLTMSTLYSNNLLLRNLLPDGDASEERKNIPESVPGERCRTQVLGFISRSFHQPYINPQQESGKDSICQSSISERWSVNQSDSSGGFDKDSKRRTTEFTSTRVYDYRVLKLWK